VSFSLMVAGLRASFTLLGTTFLTVNPRSCCPWPERRCRPELGVVGDRVRGVVGAGQFGREADRLRTAGGGVQVSR